MGTDDTDDTDKDHPALGELDRLGGWCLCSVLSSEPQMGTDDTDDTDKSHWALACYWDGREDLCKTASIRRLRTRSLGRRFKCITSWATAFRRSFISVLLPTR